MLVSVHCIGQKSGGILTGTIRDASTNKSIFDASVSDDSTQKSVTSFSDGKYSLTLSKGKHTVVFKLPGFQTKYITDIYIRSKEIVYLNILLFPVSQLVTGVKKSSDSLSVQDTIVRNTFIKESHAGIYGWSKYLDEKSDLLSAQTIQPGTDKDVSQLLKRVNGVIVYGNTTRQDLQSLNISGMGERYNQVMLDNVVLNSSDPLSRSYPFSSLPVEAVDEVSLQKFSVASTPADFTGGNISIKTKDFPNHNFTYGLVGGGISDGTNGKDFYGDKRSDLEWLGLPASARNLPDGFPTTRARYSFDQKNLQEQVFLSKELKNNLAPVKYSSTPNDKILLGFGKIVKLKKGEQIGIIAFFNHQHSEMIDEEVVQAAPDLNGNPYPFPDAGKALIRSQSVDLNYRYTSQLNAIVNASILFGRNKVSLKTFVGNQYINNYLQRTGISKPDEDARAHAGINYMTEQRSFLNAQLSGEHALGTSGKFKMNWVAAYSKQRQQNPDSRNFLLRQDSVTGGAYEIATPTAPPLNLNDPNTFDANFTNSSRYWRDFTDNNFTGAVNILVPLNLLNQSQVLSGGVYIQTRYRVFYSDELLTKGPGYFSLDEILAPDRYFPGGLNVTNYYVNSGNVNNVYPTNRGNYTASDNLGASYIKLDNHFTKSLSLDWGLRMETNSQLVSGTQYQYFAGFKNPRLIPLEENNRVNYFNLLPSANIMYKILPAVELHAAYSRSVNRPQLQELSNYRYYDAASFTVRTGNPLLLNSNIDNFDAGITWMFNGNNNISVSGFHKEIDQPIEYLVSSYAGSVGNLLSTPHNMPPAKIQGLTASFKVALDFIPAAPWLSGISLFGNGNWLTSKVDAGPLRSVTTPNVNEHSLSGSPDYTVNAGIVIHYDRLPMVTVLYNRTADYVSAVGFGASYKLTNGNTVSAIPDYRTKGTDRLDIQVSQKILKGRIQLIAGVNNLSGNGYIVYQDLNGNKKFDGALILKDGANGEPGFYQGGTDNTVLNIKGQRTYYFTISYLFK